MTESKFVETYEEARIRLMAELADLGWMAVSSAGKLKGYATNPGKTLRLWFFPQAIRYSARDELSKRAKARSLHCEMRDAKAADLIDHAYKLASLPGPSEVPEMSASAE